jgi:hypothetical protein
MELKNPGQDMEYKVEEVDGSFSEFGSWAVKSTGQRAKCMIEGCDRDACWQMALRGKTTSIIVCSEHQQQAGDLYRHSKGKKIGDAAGRFLMDAMVNHGK